MGFDLVQKKGVINFHHSSGRQERVELVQAPGAPVPPASADEVQQAGASWDAQFLALLGKRGQRL